MMYVNEDSYDMITRVYPG